MPMLSARVLEAGVRRWKFRSAGDVNGRWLYQGETVHPFRSVKRQLQGDRSAEGEADDVGANNAQGVEQRQCVARFFDDRPRTVHCAAPAVPAPVIQDGAVMLSEHRMATNRHQLVGEQRGLEQQDRFARSVCLHFQLGAVKPHAFHSPNHDGPDATCIDRNSEVLT